MVFDLTDFLNKILQFVQEFYYIILAYMGFLNNCKIPKLNENVKEGSSTKLFKFVLKIQAKLNLTVIVLSISLAIIFYGF